MIIIAHVKLIFICIGARNNGQGCKFGHERGILLTNCDLYKR